MKLKDSGKRRKFASGAVRDAAIGKGAFDLLAGMGVVLAAQQFERGKQKYGPRNWEKGMPLSVFLGSGLRHAFKLMMGFDDEPHLDAALWNFQCLAEGRERVRQGIWPKKFDDLPRTYAGKKPSF